MTEIHVEEGAGGEEEDLAQELAGHEASMAAGAAEVHEEGAEEAAAEAEAAASVAAEAAAVNAASVGAAESASASAAESAGAAESAAQGVVQALEAQTAVLQSFMSELRDSRAGAETFPEGKPPVKKKADRAPAQKGRRGGWYYGKK